ncbi:MAG TPA: hypothetical protein VFZ09_44160 [Archangium sp.]|uniref:DUF6973 domain-containing protein n=1 Tax=Archangium sp. TaxID=1872627 RepID=UPI002E366102|nr:hypothetical protein [Archangium sp.]HEX5753277.1 hypothetical protein [Archangium sp.]
MIRSLKNNAFAALGSLTGNKNVVQTAKQLSTAATKQVAQLRIPNPVDAFTGATQGAQQGLNNLNRAINSLTQRFGSLSDAEKGFLSTNLHLAKPFSDAADTADQLASAHAGRTMKGSDLDIRGNGVGNALRHATWNALMVKRAYDNPLTLGDLNAASQKAREMADAHENNPKNTSVVDKSMDLHNNDIGRQVAVNVLKNNPKASDQEIFNAVVRAFEQGKLAEVDGDSRTGRLGTARNDGK